MDQGNQQQQPICEAFIMTGESMLKLSRDETESSASISNSHHHQHTTNNQNHNYPTITTIAAIPNNNNNNINSINNNTISSSSNPKRTPIGMSESKHDDKHTATGPRAPIEFKSGLLDRKSVLEAHGKPTSKGRRGWRRLFVTIKDLRLLIRATDSTTGQPQPNQQLQYQQAQQQQQQHCQQQQQQEQQQQSDASKTMMVKQQDLSTKIRRLMMAQSTPNNVKLHHSFAKRADNYTKREYVFRLRLADQSEFLMKADNEQEMNSWIEMINFASACLSSPALPSAISSAGGGTCRRYLQRRRRPILPASYTKLTYWEQLIDHEERLQRLKQELEEHLNEAPAAKSADKRSKSEFIERIAYLRQEIERYTAYVELMKKRSNSAEAILLSKHPQNASMAPSTGLGAAAGVAVASKSS
uniref:PH and SEC7 domain-containing protein 3 n=1 Tax=Aceria tosichella TaxID=561515 RepID=A0A6G1S5B5_9ACAR